jgi:hypothetical protein
VQSFVERAIREIGHDHVHDDLETILADAEESGCIPRT